MHAVDSGEVNKTAPLDSPSLGASHVYVRFVHVRAGDDAVLVPLHYNSLQQCNTR